MNKKTKNSSEDNIEYYERFRLYLNYMLYDQKS